MRNAPPPIDAALFPRNLDLGAKHPWITTVPASSRAKKAETGGWCDTCCAVHVMPSLHVVVSAALKCAEKVSPSTGLNGFLVPLGRTWYALMYQRTTASMRASGVSFCGMSVRISGWITVSLSFSSSERGSRMKVGRATLLRSMPIDSPLALMSCSSRLRLSSASTSSASSAATGLSSSLLTATSASFFSPLLNILPNQLMAAGQEARVLDRVVTERNSLVSVKDRRNCLAVGRLETNERVCNGLSNRQAGRRARYKN
mmetsp:Transcript_16238/g.50400  ORF Transcript_16238/g.50400 Transcript_16238/m.50400 type:complete len:258 (-) Transcript_16238:83-856(-)